MDTQTQIDNLTGRVNAIDGQGLQPPAISTNVQLVREITGLRTTINQVTLLLESQLKDLVTRVNQLQASVNQMTGVSS